MNRRFVVVSEGTVAHQYTGSAAQVAKLDASGIVYQRVKCDEYGRLYLAGADTPLCKRCFGGYPKAKTLGEFRKVYERGPVVDALHFGNN